MRKTCDERSLILKRTSLLPTSFSRCLKSNGLDLLNPTFIFTAEFAESLADFNRKTFRRFEQRFGRDYHFLKEPDPSTSSGQALPRHQGRGVSQIGRGRSKSFLNFIDSLRLPFLTKSSADITLKGPPCKFKIKLVREYSHFFFNP